MGQTLTHGVYLPDEGERNCYSGLAGNWNILDGAVGTIAEHTTALAGKAPAVHTHTKSDVTDLFNSANTWSASQTFTENSTFSNYITSKESAAISAGGYGKGIAFRDYQNNRLGYIQPHLTSGNEKRLVIGADSGKLSLNSTTIPNANNSYDLGTSTNKWKSFNGINPGALSLPKVDGWSSGTELTAAVGVDTTNWDMSGGTWNEMTNNIQDGWVFFAFQGCSTGDRAIVRYYGTNARYLTMGFNAVGGSGAGYYLYVAFPMAKGSTVNIAFVTSGSVMSKFIYPCMGNV